MRASAVTAAGCLGSHWLHWSTVDKHSNDGHSSIKKISILRIRLTVNDNPLKERYGVFAVA